MAKLFKCYLCGTPIFWKLPKLIYRIDVHDEFNDHCKTCGKDANRIFDKFLKMIVDFEDQSPNGKR